MHHSVFDTFFILFYILYQQLIAKNEALTKEIRMLQEENESLKMHGIESTVSCI